MIKKIIIFIIVYIVIGVPILLLISIQMEGSISVVPAVASVSIAFAIQRWILKSYYPHLISVPSEIEENRKEKQKITFDTWKNTK